MLDRKRFVRIREDFTTLCIKANEYGFNAISLDDIAHLIDHTDYPASLRQRIAAYQEEYEHLFMIAEQYDLKIFLTTDLMFFNETLEKQLKGNHVRILAFLAQALDTVFRRFPQIAGIISRIGETDGMDVQGDFRSRLIIKTTKDARRYLQKLLPVFETHHCTWIFRTWSVGAYPIGDLIWNRETLHETFRGITSKNLILSIKYGESDFFRYLPTNKQFFRGQLPKIVELQARREYEGAGEYPSFIGYDYEAYRNALREAPGMSGVMVWCQTGGWLRFRRLSFLQKEGIWNEINTWVSIRLFRDGVSTDEAIDTWRERYAPYMDSTSLKRLLFLSSRSVCSLLYVEAFARQKVFFRRLRIPTQLSVFWDHIMINHSMRQVLRCFVSDGEAMIKQGEQALLDIREMRRLAEKLKLPIEDIDFMYDTFEVLLSAREYYFREFTPELVARLNALRTRYRERHHRRYSIHLDFEPARMTRRRLRRYFHVLLRHQRGYRLTDRIFTIWILGWLYPWIKKAGQRHMPEFSKNQAMGIDTLFK